jgi:N-acetyl-gamma-glutamyl-phosphate reductase
MIAEYEDAERDVLLDAPRQYGLTQGHKHLKEMKAISGIENAPVFCPVVAPFYSGMEVTVPIFKSMLKDGTTLDDIKNIYKAKYNGPIVNFKDNNDEAGFISANAYSDLDTMEIAVFGNEDRIILTARYDNLGKGASGAAIECLNIVLGQDETTGLVVK